MIFLLIDDILICLIKPRFEAYRNLVKNPPVFPLRLWPGGLMNYALFVPKLGPLIKHGRDLSSLVMRICTAIPSPTISEPCGKPNAKRGLTFVLGLRPVTSSSFFHWEIKTHANSFGTYCQWSLYK